MKLKLILAAAAILATFSGTAATAQERQAIGSGRLFNNDYLGDGGDRWRTGSFVSSYVRAPRPYDGVGQSFGELLEYRLRAEIIAPSTDGTQGGDRPYVGALSVGLHTHYGLGVFDVGLGADVVAVGPQTGLADFQTKFHDTFSLPQVDTSNQIDDAIFVNGTALVSGDVAVGERLRFKPFVEMRGGSEDLIRVGGDLLFGTIGERDLYLRDSVTGQPYAATRKNEAGWSFNVGGDLARVADSAYLPATDGYVLTDTHSRFRVGVRYQTAGNATLFYGATRIGEEFESQSEPQTVGSLTLNFTF